jgi:hypothetical protein
MMDDEALQYLWALKRANGAHIEGLKTAIYTLEKVEKLSQKKTNVRHRITEASDRSEQGNI